MSLPTSREEPIAASIVRVCNRVLQAAIVGALLEGVRRRDPSVVTNGVAALLFAATPGYLETSHGVPVRPWQRLWISASSFLHTLGLLGPYDRLWWWDHVTHTLTSVVVAGGTDVVYRAELGDGGRSPFPFQSRASAILTVTLGFGVLWEGLEYASHAVADRVGFEPLLVHYGPMDTVLDLAFDLVGAGMVVRYGDAMLANLSSSVEDDGDAAESREASG